MKRTKKSEPDYKENDLVQILAEGVYTDDGDFLKDIKNNLGIVLSIKVYHLSGYNVLNKISFKDVCAAYKNSYAVVFEVFIEGVVVWFKENQIKKVF